MPPREGSHLNALFYGHKGTRKWAPPLTVGVPLDGLFLWAVLRVPFGPMTLGIQALGSSKLPNIRLASTFI